MAEVTRLTLYWGYMVPHTGQMRAKKYPAPTSLNEAMAEAMRAAIGAAGMSVAATEKEAGIAAGSLGKYYLSAWRAIPLDIVFQVAQALGVKVSDLAADAEARLARGIVTVALESGVTVEDVRRGLTEGRSVLTDGPSRKA